MQKDDSTWLNVALTGFALCVAFVVWQALTTTAVNFGWTERFEAWLPAVVVVCSLGVGGASAWWLGADADRHDYFLSSIGELRKVSWPNMDDTRKMTVIVCIVVFVFSIILTVFDVFWAKILNFLIA